MSARVLVSGYARRIIILPRSGYKTLYASIAYWTFGGQVIPLRNNPKQKGH